IWHLDGPQDLYFDDMRRFGQLAVVSAGQYAAIPTLAEMGPEPLTDAFDVRSFVRCAATLGAPIKAALLGQKVVAGLGNIYADEALYQAGIHPATRGLSRSQAKRLHSAIRNVLSEAIANRGTSFSLYRDGHFNAGNHYQALQIYDRAGQACGRCGQTIRKFRLAGRGTHFCPGCQPLSSGPPRSAG
ncbi:MAG: DNA-formamidopyrimidine glycosylase, partial [Cyanobacteria bacterium REEB65]|nr:DNA-formamidopyrimidine glycosylase [Cyanobacteria bacterium REEB65]